MTGATSEAKSSRTRWLALGDAGVTPVMLRLVQERATGVLILALGDQRLYCIFQTGSVVYASSNVPSENLGNWLLARNLLTVPQLEEALKISRGQNRPLGLVLVQQGVLKREVLLLQLRGLMRGILLRTFAWEGGHYNFEAQTLGPRETLKLSEHALEIPLSGLQATHSPKRLEHYGLSETVTYVCVTKHEDLWKTAPLGENGRRIFALASSGRSVGQIISETGLEEGDVWRLIVSLVALGRLTVQKEEVSVPTAPQEGVPSVIPPENSVRITLPEPEADLGDGEDFVIPTMPIPETEPSGGPTILGEASVLQSMQEEYEGRQRVRPASEEVESTAKAEAQDPTFEEDGETTLENLMVARPEVVPAVPPPKESTRLEEIDHSRHQREIPDPAATPEPVVAAPPELPIEATTKTNLEAAPRPDPAPTERAREKEDLASEREAKPAPSRRQRRETEEREEPAYVESEMPRSGRSVVTIVGSSIVSAVLLIAGLGLLVYSDPSIATREIDRLRLMKMYGRPTLDARRLGQYYQDEGQLRKAREQFEVALREAPTDDRLEFSLARVAERLLDYETARTHYQNILTRNPGFLDARLGLGWCLLREGMVPEAKEQFTLYLTSSPISPQTEALRRLVSNLQ